MERPITLVLDNGRRVSAPPRTWLMAILRVMTSAQKNEVMEAVEKFQASGMAPTFDPFRSIDPAREAAEGTRRLKLSGIHPVGG